MNARNLGRNEFQSADGDDLDTVRWASGLDADNPIYSYSAAASAARAGDDASAERLFLRALGATEESLGVDHPFMLLVGRGLAAHYGKTGRANEMVELAGSVVAAADLAAVAHASDRTLRALVDLCSRAGRLSAAVPFLRSALANRREHYGDRHPKTLTCLSVLADVHRKLSKWDKARVLHKARNVSVNDCRDDVTA